MNAKANNITAIIERKVITRVVPSFFHWILLASWSISGAIRVFAALRTAAP